MNLTTSCIGFFCWLEADRDDRRGLLLDDDWFAADDDDDGD